MVAWTDLSKGLGLHIRTVLLQGQIVHQIVHYLETYLVRNVIKMSADTGGKYSCCATCFRARMGPSISLTGKNILFSD